MSPTIALLATSGICLTGAGILIASPFVTFALRGDEMSERTESALSTALGIGIALVYLSVVLLTFAGFAAILQEVTA